MITVYKMIHEHLKGADFYEQLDGRLYFGEAKQNGGSPYAVLFGVSIDIEDTFEEDIKELVFQVNIYSDSTSALEVLSLARSGLDALDGAVLYVPGYRKAGVTNSFQSPPLKGDGFWTVSLEFTTILQKG